ncbi:MAG: DUF29 domain-containing protein [Candidatus Competibacteraceae bacterium]
MATPKTIYSQDFYAWASQNAALLKARRFDEVDIDHVVEELESMSKSERRELINRLAILLAHLLKWRYQPERRGNSWIGTIEEQRLSVLEVLEDSPSLKYELDVKLTQSYLKALAIAVKDTGLSKVSFPLNCPWTLEQILDNDFWPDSVD